MAHTAAVQILINLNGKSLTLNNNKKNVVSLKVSRVLGDAANKFNLELFDETAWKLESALYNTKQTPISIVYGATADWANGKHITFTGMCTNYNLSFVGQATMLSIEGVIYAAQGIDGSSSTNFWFKRETVNWCDTTLQEPDPESEEYKAGIDKSIYRRACKVDGKAAFGNDSNISEGERTEEGYQDINNEEYNDRTCARIEWLPPRDANGKEITASGHWEYRILVNPANIFKRIIKKYNGEIGLKYEHTAQDWDDNGNPIWYEDSYGKGDGYGNFHLGDVDPTLWVDATNLNLTQTNTTASDFITNTLCKIAVKPESKTAGFNYYIKDGKHYFKAIDYSSNAADKVVRTGYFTKDSDVISFSLNQSGAMVMAGAENDPDTNEPLVDMAAIDTITGQVITSEGYFAEGNYIADSKMDDGDATKGNSTNWYFRKVSSARVVSSSNQNILDVAWGDAFNKITEFPLSASITIWGEYNNKYVPGNYLDLTVMTPDGKKHYSSGKYFILSADDSVTSDGYTTTLKLFKGLDETKNTFNTEKFTAKKMKAGTYGYGGIDPFANDSGSGGGDDGSGLGIGTLINLVSNKAVTAAVWSALKAAGYSNIATAAAMGNIYCESGFNSATIEKGSGIGFGLCQWSFGRRTNLEAYARSLGKSASDLSVQISFLLAELTPGGGAGGYANYQIGGSSSSKYDGNRYTASDWTSSNDINKATIAFMSLFERPSYAANINHIDRRRSAASQYLSQFS